MAEGSQNTRVSPAHEGLQRELKEWALLEG